MAEEKWVIDVTNWPERLFCPVKLDENGEIIEIITGINLIADFPPGPIIAVIHADGQEAVEQFCDNNPFFLSEITTSLQNPERE